MTMPSPTARIASVLSLCTLTAQNSVLSILLHYSQTAPGIKPYSAASAVLLSELIKGFVSFLLALHKAYSESRGYHHQTHHGIHNGAAYEPLLPSQQPPGKQGLGNIGATPSKVVSGISTTERGYAPSSPYNRAPSIPEIMRGVTSNLYKGDAWKLSVPAACYVLQNNLGFFAAQNLDVATFQVSYQMKILTTALFSVLMLGRQLSRMKWASLVGLASGVAVVQLSGLSGTAVTESTSHSMNRFAGFIATLIGCTTSGFAGVYFEKVLKTSQTDVWTRNVQLSLWSLPPAFVAAAFPDISLTGQRTVRLPTPDDPTWLFGNITGWPLVTVLFQAFGGIITALVIKYADNIAKGFATSLSIILSFMAGVALFHSPITVHFLLGSAMVLCATYMYNLPDKPTITANIDGATHTIQIPERPITPPLRSPIPPEVGPTESLHASQFQAQVVSGDNKLKYTNRLSISHGSSGVTSSPSSSIPVLNAFSFGARPTPPDSAWQTSEKESHEVQHVNGSPYAAASPLVHTRSVSAQALPADSGPNARLSMKVDKDPQPSAAINTTSFSQSTPLPDTKHLHRRGLSKAQL